MEDIEITFSFRKDEELDIMDGHGEVSLITEEDLVKIGLIFTLIITTDMSLKI